MHIYRESKLYEGEKSELLHGPLFSHHGTVPWFTKDKVMFIMKVMWDFSSFSIQVNKILWDSESNWTKLDTVDCERVTFDMYNFNDLDELVGYLFRASIDGYTIRYVSSDNSIGGIFLERSKDNSTNIDEDVMSTLVEVVKLAIEDKKPKYFDEVKGW